MQDKLVISNIKGGFGNQLHQYGTGLAQALKLKAKFKVDLSFFEQEKYRNWYKLDKINVNIDIASTEEIDVLKNSSNPSLFFRGLKKLGVGSKYNKKTDISDIYGFQPDKRILELSHSAYLSGWCPKEVYVRPIRPLLIEQFTPKDNLSSCAKQYLKLLLDSNSVSIHIRRGDYLALDHFFRIIPLEYYKEAVSNINKKVKDPKFFVFSNDIDWAMDNFKFIKDPIFVSLTNCEGFNGYADIEEFELMKNCQHNIIGNSSFSWWAAYLNNSEEKIVISPKLWFNDKFYQSSLDKHSIFPNTWVTL